MLSSTLAIQFISFPHQEVTVVICQLKEIPFPRSWDMVLYKNEINGWRNFAPRNTSHAQGGVWLWNPSEVIPYSCCFIEIVKISKMISHDSRTLLAAPTGKVQTPLPTHSTSIFPQQLRDFPSNETEMFLVTQKKKKHSIMLSDTSSNNVSLSVAKTSSF